MIPLNVTHTAIVTQSIHHRILNPNVSFSPDGTLPPAATPLRHMLSTLINFFTESYKSTFGFMDGPPLHDALTIAYVAMPELFTCRRYRVDVELSGEYTAGETVVDIWNYRACDDSWGRNGKNCLVAERVDVRNRHGYAIPENTTDTLLRSKVSSSCSSNASTDATMCLPSTQRTYERHAFDCRCNSRE